VVGKIGDDLRMDYTAQGPVVHLASRAQQLAEADTSYLGSATAARVRPYFRLESLGEFDIRGVEAPQNLYRLIGPGEASSRFDVARGRGLTSFVGRDNEMRILETALEQAAGGNGQVVGIGAEAGTGKSRLCFEFLERLRSRGLKVLYGTCVAHGRNLAFHPILQVLKNYYGIGDHDTPAIARSKVRECTLPLGERFIEDLPLVYDFLGISDPREPPLTLSPQARQRRLFAMLHENLRHGPERGQGVAVAVIEDLHWIDKASDEWIAQWVDSTAGAPSLLIVNFRPEYRADWTHRTHYQQISLAPLSLATTRALLLSLLGPDPSLSPLIERLHAETGGNPFYAEEVVQSLIESGQLRGTRGTYVLERRLDRLEIPASVQAVLAARIDRLGETEKQVLQAAAVIGREFPENVLRDITALSEADLHESVRLLRAAEFVNERSVYPNVTYAFKHPLTQQVAVESLLREKRRELHANVARSLENRSKDPNADAALIAHHYDGADEHFVGARWHLRASEWIGISDYNAAAKHARAIIDGLNGAEDADACRLLAAAAHKLLVLCVRLGVLEDADQIFEHGIGWARKAGDLFLETAITGAFGTMLSVDGRIEDSIDRIHDFQKLAALGNDPELILVAGASAGFPLNRMGRFDESADGVERALAAEGHNPDFGRRFWGGGLNGLLRMWQTEVHAYRSPWPEMQHSFQVALDWVIENKETEFHIYLMAPMVARMRLAGHVETDLPLLREGLAMAEDLGVVWPLTLARVALAEALLAAGEDAEEILGLMKSALADIRERRIARFFESEVLAITALAELTLGRPDSALGLCRDAVEKSQAIPLVALSTLNAYVNITLSLGLLDECGEALERMDRLSRDIGAINYSPLILWRRADVAAARGEPRERHRLLRDAHAGFVERGAVVHAATLANLLAESLHES